MRIGTASIGSAIFKGRIRCLIVLLLLLVPATRESTIAYSNYYFVHYNKLCIFVYELVEDHRPRIRDDLSDDIAPLLNYEVQAINGYISVISQPKCLQASEPNFEKQLMFEMIVKRQRINVGDDEFNLAIVGGASPNGRGPFSDFELQPIVLLSKGAPSDEAVRASLITYFRRVILPVLVK